MKYLEKKNKDKISNFSQKNLKYLFYKVQKDLKCLNVKEKQKIVLNQDFYLKGDSLVKLTNRCLLTNRRHSVLRFFKMSRLSVRHLGSNGAFPGFYKTSW